jgi:hypothetical protein
MIWTVRRSFAPMALPGPVLGTVRARDRYEALTRAAGRFPGVQVAVEPQSGTERAVDRLLADVARAGDAGVSRLPFVPCTERRAEA